MKEQSALQKPIRTPSQKNLKLPIVILIFLCLLALGFVVVLGYKYSQATNNKPFSNGKTQTTNTLSTPTFNSSIEDWKTYTNDTHGFTLKYPQDIEDMREIFSGNQDQPLYTIRNNYLAINSDKYAVEVAVWNNPSNSTLEDWLQYMKDSQALALPSTDYQLSVNYQVNGLDATKFWEDPLSNGKEPGRCYQACPVSDTYFVKGSKTYRVLVVFFTEVDENLSQLPDLILSTFKFLN